MKDASRKDEINAWKAFLNMGNEPAAQDKTAVGKSYLKKTLKSVPFVSQLQQEAIRRQKEAEPQSRHVEPLFLPFKSGAISKLKKAHNILEKLSDKESQQDEPRYYN